MKTWQKPKLIVLVKGTADERVLQGCKGQTSPTAGPTQEQGACMMNGDFCGPCNVAVS